MDTSMTACTSQNRRICCEQPVVDRNHRWYADESAAILTVSSTAGTQLRNQQQARIDIAKTVADDGAHSRWGAPWSCGL